MNSITPLLMTHILRCLPTARHHSLVCCAGSLGYHSLKEMLLSGVPGHTLLIESEDLREVTAAPNGPPCCLLYSFKPGSEDDSDEEDYDEHKYDGWGSSDFDDMEEEDINPEYNEHIPQHITHVTIYSDMTTLDRYILTECTSLTSVDLSPLSHVTEIEEAFLEGCSNLEAIDLSPLVNLRKVKYNFLSYCTNATTITLPKLLVFDYELLCGCTSLKTIDLSPLSNVTIIQRSFLLGCEGLEEIDLSPPSSTIVIHRTFMLGCSRLTTIDLSPLTKVKKVGPYFLDGCTGLAVIDMRWMKALQGSPGGRRCDDTPILLPSHLAEE